MDEIVGKLNFPGDIRETGGREVQYSPRHGAVRPVMTEYDADLDRTTVSYAPVAERTEIAPGDEGRSLAWEALRRKRAADARWTRAVMGGAA